jgi:hypothetical protein
MEVREHSGGGQFYLFGKPHGPKFGSGSGTKAGTRQTSASSPKGVDRRGDLVSGGQRQLGGGRNEGNLGKKTLLGA